MTNMSMGEKIIVIIRSMVSELFDLPSIDHILFEIYHPTIADLLEISRVSGPGLVDEFRNQTSCIGPEYLKLRCIWYLSS